MKLKKWTGKEVNDTLQYLPLLVSLAILPVLSQTVTKEWFILSINPAVTIFLVIAAFRFFGARLEILNIFEEPQKEE